MTNEKKKPKDKELSEEQMNKVAGGGITYEIDFNPRDIYDYDDLTHDHDQTFLPKTKPDDDERKKP